MASFMKEFEHLEIQLEDIKSATNNFDESKVIGTGGFGKVYAGELSHSKGRGMVALKRLDRKHGQGDPQFWKEIMMLSRYTHENLISLLGFCNKEGEMILVYEHASRGSLDRYLKDATLTWTQRIKICLDSAKGLSFLHDPNESQQRVIHCDVKSANILLDDNLNAKVSDFGLSKMGSAEQQFSVIITNPVGTPGYCDPLYMETYQLTKESDVYSFGVVLFEVLCGRQCVKIYNPIFFGSFFVYVLLCRVLCVLLLIPSYLLKLLKGVEVKKGKMLSPILLCLFFSPFIVYREDEKRISSTCLKDKRLLADIEYLFPHHYSLRISLWFLPSLFSLIRSLF